MDIPKCLPAAKPKNAHGFEEQIWRFSAQIGCRKRFNRRFPKIISKGAML